MMTALQEIPNKTHFRKRADGRSETGFHRIGIASERVPAVTVLTSTYNGERYLDQAIRSILRQTWTDFEYIIVDDSSTDRTAEIVESYRDSRIRRLQNDVNLGVTKSLNRGLAAARGKLVAIQDHDDVSHPKRLTRQVAFMSANPAVALAGTQVRIVNGHGRVCWRPGWRRPLTPEAIRFQSMFDNPFNHPTIMFRREVICNEFDGYNEAYVTGHDYDLLSRVAERHPVRNLPQVLFDYRVHESSMGKRYAGQHLALSRTIVKRNLCAYLKRVNVPEEWTYLISSLHINNTPSAVVLERFTVAAEEIHTEFLKSHPEAKTDRQIQQVIAAKLSQVACMLARTNRQEGIAALTRAGRFHGMAVVPFIPKLVYSLSTFDRSSTLDKSDLIDNDVFASGPTA